LLKVHRFKQVQPHPAKSFSHKPLSTYRSITCRRFILLADHPEKVY